MSARLASFVVALALNAMAAVTGCAAPGHDDSETGGQTAMASAPRTADLQATPATAIVLENLRSFDFDAVDPFDRRILVGQEEADVSNRSVNGLSLVPSDMKLVTGKAPALVSYELSSVDREAVTMFDRAAFRGGAAELRKLVLDQHAKGALVSLVWHLRCPKKSARERDRYSPHECPGDYTLEQLLERTREGTTGAHFAEWRGMLDELADFLFSLKDGRGELIPVQLRPFHEFTGSWFWWGRTNGPDNYAAAWREMVSYLHDGRGVHNVLWVFCPAKPTDWLTRLVGGTFESFYPGDRFVDVVGFDRYDLDDGSFARGYEADIATIGGFARAHGKVAAVAEVGTELATWTDPTWFTRAMLAPLKSGGQPFAYVGLWRNAPWEKFVPEPDDGAIAQDFSRMMTDPAVLTAGQHDLYAPLHGPDLR